MTEHNARLGGIKQEIHEFKAQFNFLLVDLKNEIQTKFGNINNKRNEIENNIKSNITEQVNESIISVRESIINDLKGENKLLKKKVLNLVHKLSQSKAHIFFFYWDSLHQSLTATTSYGVTRKEPQKRLQDKENLFRKKIQLKDVC